MKSVFHNNDGKAKDEFWQVIRGICMLAVVMIHCPAANEYGSTSMPFIVWIVIRQIIDFPVAIFFFMSGYFTNTEQSKKIPGTYIVRRGGVCLSHL